MINRLMGVLVIFCISLCFHLVGSRESFAKESNNSDKQVRVGIYNNYPVIYEKGGQPTGFHLEILKDVASIEGWTLSYSFHSSLKNVIEGLETGTVDLGLGIESTEERRQFLDFTTEKNAFQTGQIFVKSGRNDIQTMKDLEGKSVVLLSQSVAGDYLVETCERLKINAMLRRVNSYQEMAEAVATGSVDAGLFNDYHRQILTPLYKIQFTPIVFKSTEVQYAVPKNENSFLIEGLDKYLRSGKIANKSTYHQLEKKFYPALPVGSAKGWGKRQIIIAVSLCLLLVVLAIMVGVVLPHFSKETTLANFAREDVQHVIKFVIATTAFFWTLDSIVGWLMFNDVQKMTLFEWFLTDIPSENLYLRGILFAVASVFGLYLIKYLYKYQQLVDVLIASLTRFEQLTDNARDMIFRMSLPAGDYEFVSKASFDIFGYTPAEFYQQPLLLKKIVHQDWEKYFSEQWEDLLSGKAPVYYEYQVINKAGQIRWINQRNTVYLNESGKPYALEGIVTDITSQKQDAANFLQDRSEVKG